MKIEDTEPIPETDSSRPRKTYTNDSSRRKKETLLSKDTTTGSSTSHTTTEVTALSPSFDWKHSYSRKYKMKLEKWQGAPSL
jgi:hypothetical protein